MSDLFEAVGGELSDESHMGFPGEAVQILILTLVGITIVRLWILGFPLGHLVLVDPDTTVFDPSGKLVESLRRLVRADSAPVLEVPTVNAADQIVASDRAIGKQSTTV